MNKNLESIWFDFHKLNSKYPFVKISSFLWIFAWISDSLAQSGAWGVLLSCGGRSLMMGVVPTDWEGGICWNLSCFVMGKSEDDVNLRTGDETVGDSPERNAIRCCCYEWISRFFGLKCFFMLLLSVSLFISALFSLFPFPMDREDSNLDLRFRGNSSLFNLVVPEFL